MQTNMLNILRGVLPSSVKQFAKALLGLPPTRIHPDWQILASLGPVASTHVVFDLGARNGWFFSCWKKYSPQAQVVAFEPDKKAYDLLRQRYRDVPDIHLSDKGVGASESTKTFYHMADSEVSSSFLAPKQTTWNEIQYRTGEIEERQLAITTLDTYCAEHQVDDIYLMKIDIQGYELEALKGAKQTLQKTSYLLIESSIKALYEDSASFTQVYDYMATHGFHLMDFRAWHRGNNVLIETDMLFRRNDLAPRIEPNQELDREYT